MLVVPRSHVCYLLYVISTYKAFVPVALLSFCQSDAYLVVLFRPSPFA